MGPSHFVTAQDHSYCRNPGAAGESIWCYTSDSQKRWEYCDPKCFSEALTAGGTVKGSDYKGCQIYTVAGKECQVWASQTPHTHSDYTDIGEHNYCRNPSSIGASIWCYTADPSKRWDYCTPKCAAGREGLDGTSSLLQDGSTGERRSARGTGAAYQGCQAMTNSGRVCMSWQDQTPHTHNHQHVGKHNYCRNPGGAGNTIWCFTTDPNLRWEYCTPLTTASSLFSAPGASFPQLETEAGQKERTRWQADGPPRRVTGRFEIAGVPYGRVDRMNKTYFAEHLFKALTDAAHQEGFQKAGPLWDGNGFVYPDIGQSVLSRCQTRVMSNAQEKSMSQCRICLDRNSGQQYQKVIRCW